MYTQLLLQSLHDFLLFYGERKLYKIVCFFLLESLIQPTDTTEYVSRCLHRNNFLYYLMLFHQVNIYLTVQFLISCCSMEYFFYYIAQAALCDSSMMSVC